MFDASLRLAKDRWLNTLTQWLSPVPPLAITAIGFVLGVASAVTAALQWCGVAFVLFWLGRLCDGLDGAVARATGKQSALGGYLDLMADFVVYAAVPIGIWWSVQAAGGGTALITLLAVFYVNAASWMLLSAILAHHDAMTTVGMPAGLIEGFETLVFYSLFFLFPQWQITLFYVFAALVGVTALQRVAWAVRHLK
jgi:phosphatidylserine synthase